MTNPPPLGSTNEPPATNPATDNPPPNSSPGNGDGGSDGGGGGLSGGATAAIVIVVLLLVGGAGAGFVIYRKKDLIRMRQFSYGRHRENNSGGVVNETYAEGKFNEAEVRTIYAFNYVSCRWWFRCLGNVVDVNE